MFDDFKELLSIFNDQKVKYLIVGGYAVSLHAQPRATKDIDLLIQPAPANGKAVYAALKKFGAPLAGLTAADFIERDKFFRMGRAPVMVDILPEISGVDFDRAWQRRVEAVIDPVSGLTASFISDGYDVFFDFNGIATGGLRARHTRKHQGTCAFPRRAHSVSVGAL
jgi:hypothetical protein